MRILLAEDSAVYRHLIAAHLKEWDFDFVCARDGKEAWKLLLERNAPSLALLDWVLPEIDGLELCRRLRSRSEKESYTYTVLLTAKNEKQDMLAAMAAGADDFLVKPFDAPELKARLLAGKRIVELQQKLVSANNALHFAATHDFLTRVWNRAEILAFLHRELARCRRDNAPVGIILADVDHFKRINDELGHQTGDCVLTEIAKRFSECLRVYDGVGRYGGEEFLIVMPGCDLATIVRRANELRDSISSKSIRSLRGASTITVSMGAGVAESSTNVEMLLQSADVALYRAKRNGRNRVEEAANTVQISAAD